MGHSVQEGLLELMSPTVRETRRGRGGEAVVETLKEGGEQEEV